MVSSYQDIPISSIKSFAMDREVSGDSYLQQEPIIVIRTADDDNDEGQTSFTTLCDLSVLRSCGKETLKCIVFEETDDFCCERSIAWNSNGNVYVMNCFPKTFLAYMHWEIALHGGVISEAHDGYPVGQYFIGGECSGVRTLNEADQDKALSHVVELRPDLYGSNVLDGMYLNLPNVDIVNRIEVASVLEFTNAKLQEGVTMKDWVHCSDARRKSNERLGFEKEDLIDRYLDPAWEGMEEEVSSEMSANLQPQASCYS
jgi:hypothetical protein